MKDILKEQNTERSLTLLVAQRVLYSRSKYLRQIELLFLLLSAVVSVFSIIPFEYFEVIPDYYFSIFASLLLIISFFIGYCSNINQTKAANIQEQFDCALFELEYETIISSEEVIRVAENALAKDVGLKEQVRNWYSDAISKFDFPYSALACQQQNIGWNISLSKRYFKFLLYITLLELVLTIVFGFSWNSIKSFLNLENLYNFFVFAISFLKSSVIVLINLRKSIKEKEEFLNRRMNVFQDINNNEVSEMKHILKSTQEKIYEFRKNHRPIPDYFYKFYKYKEEARSRKRLEI